MTRKILWKSEFWSYAKIFGAFTLFCAAYLIMHLVHHEPGEAFACAIIVTIPLILTFVLAFTDSDRIKRAMRPEALERAKREAWEDSFLNPKNIPPNKRNPPPGMIG